MKRLFLSLCLVVLAAITVACSGAAADNPASAGPVDPNAPVITAQNMAFSPTTLDVTANKAFSLTLDNKDGAPHNVAIYTDSSASSRSRSARSSARASRPSRCRRSSPERTSSGATSTTT